MFGAYLAFALIGSAATQIVWFGACPNVTVKQDFDVSRFVGKWYEAQRYLTVFEVLGKCTTATYTANDNGTIGVSNKQLSSITGWPSCIQGFATQDENEKAKLSVEFPSVPIRFAAPFWVLDTDYDTFAVAWSCKPVLFFNTKFAWILTREQQPPGSVLQKAYAVFDANGISRSHLHVTNQKDCPKEPEENA